MKSFAEIAIVCWLTQLSHCKIPLVGRAKSLRLAWCCLWLWSNSNGYLTSAHCTHSGDLDTGLWLAKSDHVTWVLASDWLTSAHCTHSGDRRNPLIRCLAILISKQQSGQANMENFCKKFLKSKYRSLRGLNFGLTPRLALTVQQMLCLKHSTFVP